MFIKQNNNGVFRDPSSLNLPSYRSTTISEDGERVRFDVLEYVNFQNNPYDYQSKFPRYIENPVGLIKSSHYGKRYGTNSILFDQYFYSEYPMEMNNSIDLNRFDGLIKGRNFNDNSFPENVDVQPLPIPTQDDDTNHFPICDTCYLDKNQVINPIYQLGDFVDNIEILENDLQVPYMYTFGLLEIPMIATCENYPMYADIIFDSDLGNNGKFKTLKMFQNDQLMAKSLKTIENVIDAMFDMFRGYCKQNDLHLRMHVHITPFEIITSGFHKRYPKNVFIHKHSLIDSVSAFNSLENVHDYVDSDLYDTLYKHFSIPWTVHNHTAFDRVSNADHSNYKSGYGYSHIAEPAF